MSFERNQVPRGVDFKFYNLYTPASWESDHL
jgi:hypothetical protein